MSRSRIVIVGNSCSGKSTLGHDLGACLNLPVFDLDDLYSANLGDFRRRTEQILCGSAWLLCGSYIADVQDIVWSRADTVVWLDISLPRLVYRVFRRTRARSKSGLAYYGEYETFRHLFDLRRRHDSLLYRVVRTDRRRRRVYVDSMGDPRWAHISFIRLTTPREVQEWLRVVRRKHCAVPAQPEASRDMPVIVAGADH